MPSYTLAQLDAACLDRVENNSVLYTAPERYAIINESLRILNLFVGFYQVSLQVPGFSIAGQLLYRPPTGIIIPTGVDFEGIGLRRTSLKGIARSRPKWAQEASDSYGPPSDWIPLGIGLFAIHPMDADGGNEMSVTGIANPPLLSDPLNDKLSLEDEYAEIVTEYFGHRAPLKEGGAIFAASGALYKLFLSKMKQKGIHENLRMPAFFLKSIDQGAQE